MDVTRTWLRHVEEAASLDDFKALVEHGAESMVMRRP